jgi:hypothetical protein
VTGRSFASGPVAGILGQIVSNIGSLVGPEIAIATTGAPAPNGQVVYNPNTNEYFATWRDQVEGNLKGQRITASGNLIGDAIVISPVFPEFGLAASVVFDPTNDRYLVVFGVFQEMEILGQFVSSSGELIGANFLIATSLPSRANPYIAYSGIDNAFVVVWQEAGNIVGQLLSDDGIVIEDKVIIAQGTAFGNDPRLAYNSEIGEFLVVWSDNRNVSQGEEDIFAQLIGITSDQLIVVVDIKPGSDPNSINPRSKGVIPVAILGTASFDATQVNAESVEFGPDGAKEAHGQGHVEDVDGDDVPDIMFHFKTQETGFQCGDTKATLTGQTFSGEEFTGTDSIQTVGCKKK